MRTTLTFAVCAFCLGSALHAADDAIVTKRTALSFRLDVPEPDSVAKARLYVTEDGGVSWKAGEEVARGEPKSPLPRLRFTADHDGVYGFNTRVTYLDQHADPEPQAGQAPDYEVVVDTKAPVIESFEAALISAGGDSAAVHIAWRADDLHFAAECAVLEASANGTAFTAVQRTGSSEDRTVTSGLDPGQRRLLLLLSISDQAGNETVSAIRALDIPEPAALPQGEPAAPAGDVSAELDEALNALPTLTEAPKLEETPVAEPVAAPVLPKAAPSKPVVVAAAPDTSLEREYHRKLESLRQNDNRNSGALWKKSDNTNRIRLEQPAQARPKKAPALRETTPTVEPALSGLRSQSLLNQARSSAAEKNFDRAEELYLRLRKSDLAAQSLPEEIRMLANAGRAAQALQIIEQQPQESCSDPIRLEHGKLLIAAGRIEEGIAALVKIGRGSASAPDALYHIALSYIAQHKDAEAKRVLEYLARGRGEIASAAAEQLRNMP
jgi:tetratricopeptide (TPR) repeat protein